MTNSRSSILSKKEISASSKRFTGLTTAAGLDSQPMHTGGFANLYFKLLQNNIEHKKDEKSDYEKLNAKIIVRQRMLMSGL